MRCRVVASRQLSFIVLDTEVDGAGVVVTPVSLQVSGTEGVKQSSVFLQEVEPCCCCCRVFLSGHGEEN